MSDEQGERNSARAGEVRAESRHDGAAGGALCTYACGTSGCWAECVLPGGHRVAGQPACACVVHAAIADAAAASADDTICGQRCRTHPQCSARCELPPEHRYALSSFSRCACPAHSAYVRSAVPVTPADFDQAQKDAAAAPDLVARVKQLETELAEARETLREREESLLEVTKARQELRQNFDKLHASYVRDTENRQLGQNVRAVLGNPGCALRLLAFDRAPMVTLETKWGELAFENESLDDGIAMAAEAASLRAPKHEKAGAR